MSKEFLPKNYEVSEPTSNYMRFQDGINRFRIMGSAVTGFEYFTSDNKPVRSKEEPEETPNIKKDGKVKEFWAFPVWNYQTESIQILELTQKTIMKAIKSFVENPKWGSPFLYDIAVTRTGESLETEYQTQAEPPIGEVSEDIKKAFEDKKIKLDALFEGEDPFK